MTIVLLNHQKVKKTQLQMMKIKITIQKLPNLPVKTSGPGRIGHGPWITGFSLKYLAALAQMSSERAKMQELFQSDRKKLKTELEENISKLNDELGHLKTRNESLEIELKQSETRLRDSVREMEAENSASKIANRELQKQLNSERKKFDEAESQMKKKNEIVSKLRADLKEAYEVSAL